MSKVNEELQMRHSFMIGVILFWTTRVFLP